MTLWNVLAQTLKPDEVTDTSKEAARRVLHTPRQSRVGFPGQRRRRSHVGAGASSAERAQALADLVAEYAVDNEDGDDEDDAGEEDD